MSPYSPVIGALVVMASLAVHGQHAGLNARMFADLARAAARQESVVILEAGSLHGDEVPDNAAGDWLALVREGNDATLRPVSVSLVPEQDMMDEEGEETGRRVEVSPPLDPIVLVRGLPSFTGQVTTALMDEGVDVGHDLDARLTNLAFRFSVRCLDTPRVDKYRRQRCGLTLRSDSVRQTLFTYEAAFSGNDRFWASEEPPTVLWAGDLDLDGGLDVLLDTSGSSNVSEMRLFLSSAAEPHQLVAEVARFTHTGC